MLVVVITHFQMSNKISKLSNEDYENIIKSCENGKKQPEIYFKSKLLMDRRDL